MENNNKTKVTAIEGGPLMIEGCFAIKTVDGKYTTNTEKTYLCRCGRSENKPYCDNSHKK